MSRQQSSWNQLNKKIAACASCPRLLEHCKQIAQVRRRAYQDFPYWGGPVPNFGDPKARLLIVGLAPGAHGANRTGRMFTGDRSGDWLYRALHKSGFASQPESTTRDDGMQLKDCAITGVCHCAPPANRPTVDEIKNCRHWLTETVDLLPVHVFLALGQIGWKASIDYLIAHQLWKQKQLTETVLRFRRSVSQRKTLSENSKKDVSSKHFIIWSVKIVGSTYTQ